MIKLITIITILFLSLSASDWPNFLGPNFNSQSDETGINKDWNQKQPPILWSVPMSDGGYAGPAVYNETVYIIDYNPTTIDEVVRAIDIKTGKNRWVYEYPTTEKANYGQSKTTPTISEGKVYTYSKKGILLCLDAATGKKIWEIDMIKKYQGTFPKWEYASSPFVDGNSLIVLCGGAKNVIALDKNNGNFLWRGGNSDPVGYATPTKHTINGSSQYLVFAGKSIFGLSPSDGSVLWESPWETSYDVNAASPLFIAPDKIFITSGYKKGCSLIQIKKKSVETLWKNGSVSAHFSSPTYYNKHIYASSDPGKLVCLDPKDGSVKWENQMIQKGGFIIVDGTIISLHGGNGKLTISLATETGYTELGSFTPLGDQSWTAPILSNKKLIIRNKAFLACIQL